MGELPVEILKKKVEWVGCHGWSPAREKCSKIDLTSETAGLLSQNRLIKELVLDGSGHINEEKHKKIYDVVNDSDAPVEKSRHKWAHISALANSNGNLDRSEYINEEEYQSTEFAAENNFDSAFDETPDKKLRLSPLGDFNGQPSYLIFSQGNLVLDLLGMIYQILIWRE